MGFPTPTGTNPITLTGVLLNAMTLAGVVKQDAQGLLTAAQTTGIGSALLLQFPAKYNGYLATFATYAAVPNLAAYAQTFPGNSTYNITTDYNSMVAAITACVNWVESNFPVDSNSDLQYATWSNGVVSYTTFTPSQLAPFITLLQALIAAFN